MAAATLAPGMVMAQAAAKFCNRAITLAADLDGGQWKLKAFDDQHRLAVDMEVTVCQGNVASPLSLIPAGGGRLQPALGHS